MHCLVYTEAGHSIGEPDRKHFLKSYYLINNDITLCIAQHCTMSVSVDKVYRSLAIVQSCSIALNDVPGIHVGA